MEGRAVGHIFEMGLPKDYPSQILFNLVQQQCQRRLTFQNVNNEIGCQVIQTANLAYGQER
jgi:hypothetical protein